MPTALLLALALATPFIDGNQRYSLDLPGGWMRGPLPPAANGASFHCTVKGEVALAAIRVLPASGMTAAAVARKLGESLELQPGFRLVEEGSTEIAGRPAARRRYLLFVDGNPELVKTAEDRALVAGNHAYIIHVEALSDAYVDFEADFHHIFDSFRLGATPGSAPRQGPEVGRWLMDGTTDTFFELGDDGSFDLAGTQGTYRVQSGRLLMWMTGGGMEEFSLRLDGSDGLVLSSPNLPAPIRYTRTGGAAHPVVGTWRGGGKRLVLRTDGSAEIDGQPGAFRIDGTKLVLRITGKKRLLRFRLAQDALVLTGWKFGKGTRMERDQP
jgi:hypothetical protein